MSNFPDHIEASFENLAESLQVPASHRASAERSYHSVGEWLGRANSALRDCQPRIYVQGSFSLDTAIRPITDESEYDIDAVCLLNGLSTSSCSQEQLKRAVGVELTSYAKAHALSNLPEAKRRCWTLNYADSAQFHMDILPSIPNASYVRGMLAKSRYDFQHTATETAIAITDQDSPCYRQVAPGWPVSNPEGYAKWFNSRKGIPLSKTHAALSAEPLPDHRARTPLQAAIQIAKRHRDLMFDDTANEDVDPDDKPISVILTTLAAHAYQHESTISGALEGILTRMANHVETRQGQCWIANPSYPLENFADRWRNNPQLQHSFYRWLEQARDDFDEVARSPNLLVAGHALDESFNKPSSNILALPDNRTLLAKRKSALIPSNAPHKKLPSWRENLNGKVAVKRALFVRQGHRPALFESNGAPLPKGCVLRFHAETTVPEPYSVYWQVTNTGWEAESKRQLRGEIKLAQTAGKGGLRQKERTAYTGAHSIECFIVKNNALAARSGPFIVNIQ